MTAFHSEALVRALSVPSRATILSSLMGGVALPASELSFRAGVCMSTTSFHLAQLLQEKLVRVRKIGRHRYYELNGFPVAELLERFDVNTPELSTRNIRDCNHTELRKCRWCYDHLAGALGVGILSGLRQKELIRTRSDNFELLELTRKGSAFFSSLGIEGASVRQSRRKFAFECIDWSERRPHLAGVLGAALADKMVIQGWVKAKTPDRIAVLTASGKRWLAENFDLTLDS
ncbi:ArsR/SmtB family transcription factor [Tepidicaulis sp. LMO-SS28]|uniref:ArsR/SmtB family transcription factor n=1 Tax=Tepidicaulis sp. LMO-SS28 TaxID=3447455 RepID=UPI003EE05EA3